MNSVLSTVVRDGTGVAAKIKGAVVAGKTGTTNDYNDAWFVGYTPKQCCVVSIWMGYASGGKRMTNVHGRKVSGGSFPAELFARIMTPLVEGVDLGTFAEIKDYPGELLGASRRSSGNGLDGPNDRPTATKPRRKKPKVIRDTQEAPSDSTAPRVPAAGSIDQPTDIPAPVEVVSQPAPEPEPAPSPEPAPQPEPVTPPPIEIVPTPA